MEILLNLGIICIILTDLKLANIKKIDRIDKKYKTINKESIKIMEQSLKLEFEEYGNWWIPDVPDNKIGGVLKYTRDNGATLILFGSFNDERHQHLILGENRKRERFTLIGNAESTSMGTVGWGPYHHSDFQVRYALEGTHISEVDDLKCIGFKARIPFLELWGGGVGTRTIIKFEDVPANERFKQEGFMDKVELYSKDSVTAEITHGKIIGSDTKDYKMDRFHFGEDYLSYLKLMSDKKQHFDDFFRESQRFSLLVSIGQSKYALPFYYECKLSEEHKEWMPIYTKNYVMNAREKKPREGYFTLNDLTKKNLNKSEFFLKWHELVDKEENFKLVDDYLEAINVTNQSKHIVIQKVVHILEGLLSTNKSILTVPNPLSDLLYKDLKKKFKEFISTLNNENQLSFLNGKALGNTPSLKEKLKSILSLVLGITREEAEKFADVLKNIRNKASHGATIPEDIDYKFILTIAKFLPVGMIFRIMETKDNKEAIDFVINYHMARYKDRIVNWK